jgi:hypothetical protein
LLHFDIQTPSNKVALPPTSHSVQVGANANGMKVKGKKSGTAVAFGMVDLNALVVSLVDNFVKNFKVRRKKSQLVVLEGIEEGRGASTVKPGEDYH